MNILSGADMYRVTPEFIMEYVRDLDRPDAEAILISCGGIRSLEIVAELERQIKKPVITSNQAMFWDTMRLAGIKDKIDGYGMLLKDY
jgi:maleate isomerase